MNALCLPLVLSDVAQDAHWVTFHPVVPVWLIVLGLVVGAAALWRSVVRAGVKTRLSVWVALLRSIVLLALGWIMLGPVKPVSEAGVSTSPPEGGRLTVLVDQSRSMSIKDARVLGEQAAVPRDQAAAMYLNDGVLGALKARYRVELSGFGLGLGQRFEAESPFTQSRGASTDLPLAIQQALVGSEPGDAVWVLSDGRTTTGDSAAQRRAELELIATQAMAAGVRIHVLALGGPSLQPNRAIRAQPERRSYFAGEEVVVSVTVHQAGIIDALAAGPVTVTIADADGEAIATATGKPDENKPSAAGTEWLLSIPLPEAWVGAERGPGLRHAWVSVDQVAGETHLDDNRQPIFFELTEAPARLLVVEGSPSWQTRFWVDALRADERVAVTRVTQIGQARRLVVHPENLPKPVPDPTDQLDRVDGFAAFDMVMLGQQADELLTGAEFEAMKTWVDERDGLLVVAAPIDSALHAQLGGLSPLLEAQRLGASDSAAMLLTDAGRAHPAFAAWVAGRARASEELLESVNAWPGVTAAPAEVKRGATVLATAGGHPVLVSMPYGGGLVSAALTTDLWRWWLAAGQSQNAAAGTALGSPPFADWVRGGLLGELAAGDDLRLTIAPWQQRVGEPFEVTLGARELTEALWRHAVRVVKVDRWDEAVGTDQDEAFIENITLHPVPGSQLARAGTWSSTTPGLYRFELLNAQGELIAHSGGSSGGFPGGPGVVVGVDREGLWSDADPEALWALADMTGGRVAEPGDWRSFVDDLLLEREAAQPSGEVEVAWEPAWDSGALLALIILLLGGEWLIRRKAGFV